MAYGYESWAFTGKSRVVGAPGSVMAEANLEKTTGSVGTGMFCSVQ